MKQLPGHGWDGFPSERQPGPRCYKDEDQMRMGEQLYELQRLALDRMSRGTVTEIPPIFLCTLCYYALKGLLGADFDCASESSPKEPIASSQTEDSA